MKLPNRKVKVKKTVVLETVDELTGEFLEVRIRTLMWVKFKSNIKGTKIIMSTNGYSLKIRSVLIMDSRGKKYKGLSANDIKNEMTQILFTHKTKASDLVV